MQEIVHELGELGTGGIDDHVLILVCGVDREFRQVFHIDWLNSVIAPPKNAERRELPQAPRDVVYENVIPPENHRRSENRIAEP